VRGTSGEHLATLIQRLLAVALVGAAFASPGLASEPDGRTILRYSWLPSSSGGGGARTLRISVGAAIPVHAVKLRLEASPSLQIHDPGSPGVSRRQAGRERWLGDLGGKDTAQVDLDIVIPAVGGEILVVRVEGITEDGRRFNEGMGVPVGRPGGTPTLRSGAAEFPASTPGASRP
jgi:hypothetical protein